MLYCCTYYIAPVWSIRGQFNSSGLKLLNQQYNRFLMVGPNRWAHEFNTPRPSYVKPTPIVARRQPHKSRTQRNCESVKPRAPHPVPHLHLHLAALQGSEGRPGSTVKGYPGAEVRRNLVCARTMVGRSVAQTGVQQTTVEVRAKLSTSVGAAQLRLRSVTKFWRRGSIPTGIPSLISIATITRNDSNPKSLLTEWALRLEHVSIGWETEHGPPT